MDKTVSKSIQNVVEECSLAEVTQLYKEDRARLTLPDSDGQTILHHAAKHDRRDIVNFIISSTPGTPSGTSPSLLRRLYNKNSIAGSALNLNSQDNDGNTALHLATEKGHVQVIKALLDAGASSSILNGVGQAPIHVAVVHNRTDALLAMCECPSVDVNLTGNKGVTAMHIAAFKDHDRCARILLDYGSRVCKPCEIGMPAVHVATLYGSAHTLGVIMEHTESQGKKNESFIGLQDVSKNSPLHTAVIGGDLQAVRMCLKAGVQICAKQHDKLTPVHLAAQQGHLEMIKAMLKAQPQNRGRVLDARDAANMTPLHKAALCDKASIAQYLLDQGAYIDALDSEGMSPLLLAAQKQAWETVEVLLKNAADTNIHDKNNSNFLHLIIKNGGRPEQFGCFLNNQLAKLANEQDVFGCTPLHYASEKGQLKTVLSLIDLGAILNAKNNNRESPLHFAAGNGRINTCRQILDCKIGKNTINETNGDGLTPLHVAARGGHTPVVQLLLQRGACVQMDRFGNTALHLAAEGGFLKTVQAILNVEAHLINEINKAGDTCLHLAARTGQAHVVTYLMSNKAAFETNYANERFIDLAVQYKHKDVLAAVVSHDRWDEALDPCSNGYGTESTMIGLIKQAPEICQMVLDRCIVPSNDDPRSPNFHYTYNFRFLDGNAKGTGHHEDKYGSKPLYTMKAMVEYNRETCLAHPVCLNYLKMKWHAYGIWYWAVYLVFYGIFLASLTTYVVGYNQLLVFSNSTNYTVIRLSFNELPKDQECAVLIILIFSVISMIKEIVQIIQQRKSYMMEPINLLEWAMYITCTISVVPFLLSMTEVRAQSECTATAIFLAWFNLLHFIQRSDIYGLYVVMFMEILKTLVQVVLVFSFLIIAFALAFYVLMFTDSTDQFSHPGMSLMTVIVMLLSNIEFKETWVEEYTDGDPETLYYATFSFLLLALFTLLVPILLMNLLIGLAIGDIESVQKNASLKRLAMQVALHTDMERKLPLFILKYVHRSTWTVYPNGARYFLLKNFQRLTGSNDKAYAPKDDDSGHDTLMYQELFNQKQRLRTIQSQLDRQYDLMRLVVQKMEIRSEADDQEEADNLTSHKVYQTFTDQRPGGVHWTNHKTRLRVLKHAAQMISLMRPKSRKGNRNSAVNGNASKTE